MDSCLSLKITNYLNICPMQSSNDTSKNQNLSHWWRRGIIIILLLEFAVLIWVTTGSYYRNSKPPVPEKVTDASGMVIIYRDGYSERTATLPEKSAYGQWKYLGTWAYMGPDFSAQYLHNLALEVTGFIAAEKYKISFPTYHLNRKNLLWSNP